MRTSGWSSGTWAERVHELRDLRLLLRFAVTQTNLITKRCILEYMRRLQSGEAV
ncbi:hypothetical protein GALMADRAFT_258321 [Galerina marginata CBS 339.88]|uniref:Uncharacterized protein n=1 Tax=Galerina marginata (strain CBS 339.88) TaxID=685588 RepID=A0A067SKR2_GALM3|nr:hypothetical protein GALMADRAFT_258321 [Galerina marginata CBS 339.88]